MQFAYIRQHRRLQDVQISQNSKYERLKTNSRSHRSVCILHFALLVVWGRVNERFRRIVIHLCLFRAINVAFRCFWDLMYPRGTPRAHRKHQKAHLLCVEALFLQFRLPTGPRMPLGMPWGGFCAHQFKKYLGCFYEAGGPRYVLTYPLSQEKWVRGTILESMRAHNLFFRPFSELQGHLGMALLSTWVHFLVSGINFGT